jgi:hypothetical protein
MRVYTVHIAPGETDPVLIKEGFSWPAFFFSLPWALWNRLWLVALLVVVVAGALDVSLMYAGLNEVVRFAAGLGYSVIVGYLANDWRRSRLARRGLRMEGIVAARGSDMARRRWFDLHPATIV